jgi:hypothetical protein
MAIALKQPTATAVLKMGPQFLSEDRQDRHVAICVSLGMSDVDLRRSAIQEQIFHTDLNELIHPRPGEEEGLDEQPFLAAVLIGTVDQPLDLAPVQTLDGTTS